MFLYLWIASLLFSAAAMPFAARSPQQSVAANAPDSTSALSDALSLYRKGSFDQALAKYNEILKADPHSGEA